MDTQRDFKSFRDVMDELNAVFNQGFKASDAQVRVYWDQLKDCSLSEIQANAKRYISTATSETRMPRPFALRSRPASLSTPPNFVQEKATRDSIRRWRELKVKDAITFEIEYRAARAFTLMAQCDEGDPDHEEWLNEYRRWNALRYLPRAEQESAVRRYLGQT